MFILNCSLNKVIKHHGVHFLEQKEKDLLLNKSNKNDIIKILGPPSTKGTFDNDLWIYIETTSSSSRLTRLGQKKLLTNNVLVVELNNRGILVKKDFYNLNNINKIDFSQGTTEQPYSKRNFIYSFISNLRKKINDPLNQKNRY